MKWLHYFILSLAVLSGAFFGSSILTENVSAISDLTGTIDFATDGYSQTFICEGSSCSSDYHYIILQLSGSFSSSSSYSVSAHRYTGQSLTSFNNINPLFSPLVINISNFYNSSDFYKIALFTTRANFTPTSGSLTWTLTENLPSIGSPTGSLSITQNGTFDVSSYAQAVVDVPPVIEQGDYHDDLVSINNAILIVPAVCLLIYFFYIIFGMIISTTGGKK